ncbi:tRNA lysidine(34) synthetase TilS, partial [Candidatus Sumerlaeota bacterium]
AAARQGCGRIAVAHHRDDLVETMLMNLLRGSGPRGLAGFGARSSAHELEVVRPLIALTREELEAYCRERRLKWREDASNQDESFLRNRVRHELLPLLEDGYNPRLREALLRLGRIVRDEDEWVEELAGQAYARLPRPEAGRPPTRISLRFVSEQPLALVRRCLRLWLTELRPSGYSPPLSAVDDLIHLARDVAAGGLCHLTDSLVFRRTRTHLELISREPGRRIRRREKKDGKIKQ